jgi:NADH:ubiquinone oxidoreductase subunit 2 (subunit N)
LFTFVKAVNEFNFFKLFAYSGIGNYCFALLPFFLSKNFNMVLPLFFYLYIYCLTLIGFFLLLSVSFWFSKDKDFCITGIFTFFNPFRNFIFSIFLVIYLLSFSGLPIFIGFLAKGSLSYFFVSS